jgi:hypothetical protein
LPSNTRHNILAETNAGNNKRAAISVVSAVLVVRQRCSKPISAAVNQHATTEEAVFSVGAAPRLYSGDLKQLQLELSESGDGSRRRLRRNSKKGIGLSKEDYV